MNLARTPLLLEGLSKKTIKRLRKGKKEEEEDDLPPSYAAPRGFNPPIAMTSPFGGPVGVGGIMRHS